MSDLRSDSWVGAQTLDEGSTFTVAPSKFPPNTPKEILQTELGTQWILTMRPGASITVTSGEAVIMPMPQIIATCVFPTEVTK